MPAEQVLGAVEGVGGSCVLFILSSVKQPNTDADKMKKKAAVEDRVRTFHLRKNLSYLDKMQEEKDLFIQKTREELRACRQRMELIRTQQESMAAAIASEREAGNVAAVGRLQAAARRLCTELENEGDLQAKITVLLAESENTMWHVELQQGQLEDFRKSNREEAEAAERYFQVHATRQLHREKAAVEKAERNQRLRVRKSLLMQQGHGLAQRKLAEDAQKNHRTARIPSRDLRSVPLRTNMCMCMLCADAVTSLFPISKETLRKFQAWSRAKGQLAERRAQAEKEAILAQGGDTFKHLLHQRQHQELEAQTRAFEEEQRLRKQEIVSRILKEEAKEGNRKKQLLPSTATGRWTLRDKTWSYVSDFCEGKTTAPATFYLGKVSRQAVSIESVHGDLGINLEEETLAEPEISGLWNEDHKPYQVPKEDMDRKPVGGTKMDKDILARTMERLRTGLVHRQVASGHEFKGRPFNSKPEMIHFKDFDVGKVYKKKITLINATYTINYCKLVEATAFNPPGPMSAGMSCEVLVTFKPMINKDLEGNVSFLAQTGGFSIPLKCSTKKCSLSLDKELIDFGSHVVGETASRTITLTNVGGLGTEFRFLPALETYVVSLPQSSLLTYEDKSLYEKTLTSFSEYQLEGYESSHVDMHSRKELEKLDKPERLTAVMPSVEEPVEITLGGVTEGALGPFSSVKVPIIFTPTIPGEVQTRFKVTFKTPQCPTLYFRATGVAVDVSVWVPKPNVDLKICMYDRLYQASVLVHTRSNAALRLKFEVCKELRGHMELLPETGYIQAHSSYSVQLKFLPRHSLPEDAGKYFDKESRVLEAPMTIWVADQTKPVGFTVHAVVTTSDLEISPAELDFGCCTIYEAVRTEVRLRNHSLLPQDFGFVRLPKCVDIQPGDGFGTILPLDTLQFDVIFQPTKAKEYSFELVCKSEINRCFKLSCRAVGVHPPLELSHHQIKFAATALYDTSVATVYVINSHLSMNSLTHSVPRIGSEDASPVGPTSFEFLLPPDSPITIAPSVGTVLPGKRCLVQVAFRPVLPEELIRQEALQTLNKELETKPVFWKRQGTQRRDLCRWSLSTLRLHNRYRPLQVSTHPSALRRLCSSSDRYQAAQASLARAFQGKFDKFVVPCVIASGDTKDRKGTEPLSFSPHNTLYLELWCPTVAPSVVVTSGKGKTVFDFGDVAIGHSGMKKVSIQNVSPEDLAVKFSVLDPNGPFVLLNPCSRLHTGETKVLVLSFSPRESVPAQEMLDVVTKRGTLTLTLMGTGVASMTTCSIEGDILNMGYVIARESVSSGFKLQNNSSLPIKFCVQLDSLCSRSAEAQQQLPQFLASPAQRTQVVGTQNFSGQSVFSVAPVQGIMEPGKTQDFTVTFSPDHESLYFSDRLRVTVSHQILLKGAAREHMMFVEGGDPLDVPVESLTVVPALDPEHREDMEELRPILVTLDYIQFDTDTPAPPATRELQVGCIRTTQLSPKKPDHPLMVSALLQLRGDVKETYKVIFVAQVVTGH
uniref:Cilia- and flagella-associated protein 74 n=1 Tax=Prolemur simus TaxID=1328070 RepID=A0A8C9DMG8_PROSS